MAVSLINQPAATVVATPEGVERFRAVTIRRAILLWVDCGLKANRAYTPGAMARTASGITGKTYTSSKTSLRKATEDIEALIGVAS